MATPLHHHRRRWHAWWIVLGAVVFALLGVAAGARLSFAPGERAQPSGPHFVATWTGFIEPQVGWNDEARLGSRAETNPSPSPLIGEPDSLPRSLETHS